MTDSLRMTVQGQVLHALATALKLDPHDFQAEASLAEAGVDSLGLVEAVFVIEERFDITLPFNANEQHLSTGSAQSIGQLLNQVVDLVLARHHSPLPALETAQA
jgi:acyl carrier protein